MCFPMWVALVGALAGLVLDLLNGTLPIFAGLLFILGGMLGMFAGIVRHDLVTSVGQLRQGIRTARETGRFWTRGLPASASTPVFERQAVSFQPQPGMLGALLLLPLLAVAGYCLDPDSWKRAFYTWLHPGEWDTWERLLAGGGILFAGGMLAHYLVSRRTFYRVQPPHLTLQSPFSSHHVALEAIEWIYVSLQERRITVNLVSATSERVELVLHTRGGRHSLLMGSRDQDFLEVLAAHCPNALVGYSEERAGQWDSLSPAEWRALAQPPSA